MTYALYGMRCPAQVVFTKLTEALRFKRGSEMKKVPATYLLRFVTLFLVFGMAAKSVLADPYIFFPFPDDPAAAPGTTHAMGINDAGTIVGWEIVGSSPIGFVRSAAGTFTRINCGEIGCRLNGINNNGVIVGASIINAGITAIQVNGNPGGSVLPPSPFNSEAFGVNDHYPAGGPTPNNTVVGSLVLSASGPLQAFEAPAPFPPIFPGPSGVISSQLFGVSNDSRLFVGTVEISPGVFRGIFQTGPDIASWELINVTGASRTDAFGTQLNSSSTHPAVVGEYTIGGEQHGFVLPAGNGDILQALQTIDVGGADNTRLYGINDFGQIVGQFDSHSTHGYELTPFDAALIGQIELCFDNPAICQLQINQGHIGTEINCVTDPVLCGAVSQDLVLLLGPNPPSPESLIILSTTPSAVPEPSSMLLLAIGVVAVWAFLRQRRLERAGSPPQMRDFLAQA